MKSFIKSNNYKKKINKGNDKNDTIGLSRHEPTYDSASLNSAVERAIKDEDFLNSALEIIKPVKFPVYKRDIISYLKKVNSEKDKDVLLLFESLDGYILYNDLYHIKKSIERNIPEKKLEHQISDQKRRNLNVRIRETRSNKSIKEREAVNPKEERKDYPEVTPTSMSLFICKLCGKDFQNQDDLEHHKHFERQIRKENEKEKMATNNGAAAAKHKASNNIYSASITRNKKLASRLANLLEGLEFPAIKSRIKDHVRKKSQVLRHIEGSTVDSSDDDNRILTLIEDNLLEKGKIRYNSTYEIEKAVGLVMEKKR
jgi:hypothetical protein